MEDINFELIKKIWTLKVVVKNKSFKKAAIELKVSPPAISQTIKFLESHFSTPLLIRQLNSVTPTLEAENILSNLNPAFEIFATIYQNQREKKLKLSWINIGTYESLAIDLFPKMLKRLQTMYPHLKVGIKINRTSQLLTLVRKGEICSALITENDNLEKFSAIKVAEDRLGIYASKSHSILQSINSSYLFGALSPNREGHPRYYQKFIKQFSHVKQHLTCDSFEVIRKSIESGSIIGVLPHRVAMRNSELVEITQLLLQNQLLHNGKHVILLVSLANCDKDEMELISSEAKRILHY